MNLIIKISEEDRIRIGNLHFIPEELRLEIAFAISNGTPLEQIKSEIRKKITFNSFNEGVVKYDDILEVINKYMKGGEKE